MNLGQMKPDGRYRGPATEVDASVKSDAATVETFRPGLRMPAVLAVALVTSAASVVTTYMVTHANPADCASKGELHAVDTKLDAMASTVTALGPTIAKNADQAKNDLGELRATVNENARNETARIETLTNKLDLFMSRH